MLNTFGLAILSFMLAMYLLSVVYGVIFAILFVVKKRTMDAVRTIAYVILLGMTTVLSSIPFLNVHGSHGDLNRLLLIIFSVVNIVLMFIFAMSRLKVLNSGSTQTSQASTESDNKD